MLWTSRTAPGELPRRRCRNIQRLRDGAFAVVTGQQVGLFGGPLLSLLKAASVLALAKQVEALGVECVPVFWMATRRSRSGRSQSGAAADARFRAGAIHGANRGIEGAPVANIRFAEGTNEIVARLRSCWANRLPPTICARATSKARHFPTRTQSSTRESLREHGLILPRSRRP